MTCDPYEILGVDKSATPDEIAKAYKRKAKGSHPDQGGSAEDFTRVKQASLVLLDPVKRDRYDRDGVIDENKPDNLTANAMEKIAQFFVNSINATVDHPLNLDQLDLVSGANQFFTQGITECQNQIAGVTRQIAQFDKALKRLKTKRKNDVVRTMVGSHTNQLRAVIEVNKQQVRILTTAKEILKDYEFEQVSQQPQSPYRSGIINPYTGRIF